MKITQNYLPLGGKRRSGQKLVGVKFIVAHDTGNDSSTAAGNVNYYKNSVGEMSASAHTFIDDKDIIECIPLDEKAWHVLYNVTTDNRMFGVDANDYALGIELCYFSKDKERSLKAYSNYVNYIAQKTLEYNLNPKTKIVGHYTLDPARKTDPINAFKTINKTWEQFIEDVCTARVAITDPKPVAPVAVPTPPTVCLDTVQVENLKQKVKNKEVLGLFGLIKKLFNL